MPTWPVIVFQTKQILFMKCFYKEDSDIWILKSSISHLRHDNFSECCEIDSKGVTVTFPLQKSATCFFFWIENQPHVWHIYLCTIFHTTNHSPMMIKRKVFLARDKKFTNSMTCILPHHSLIFLLLVKLITFKKRWEPPRRHLCYIRANEFVPYI